MLKNLLIKNYALIRELEMSPSRELNIITGETGAGKSIMLGAIGLLLGNRADTKVLFDQNEKCIIEGVFDISNYNLKPLFEEEDIDFDEASCIIRREISTNGKSRAFINDTPVTLDALKKWGAYLMDIHSQHETLLLGNQNFQLSIIDAYAGNKKILESYQSIYKEFVKVDAELEALKSSEAETRKQLDYDSFLLEELKGINLEDGEQEKLEEELKVLENAEEIKAKLVQNVELISNSEINLLQQLQQVEKNLLHLSEYSPTYQSLAERVSSCLIELKDIGSELEAEESKVEFDPEQVERVGERLSRIYSLQKKHQVATIGELLQIQEELESKVNQVLDLDETIVALEKKVKALKEKLLAEGEKLSATREKIIPSIKKELSGLLKDVGMPNASVEITQKKGNPGLSGLDSIAILFSANKGVAPQELKNSASGGEFSRLMLCLKYMLAGKTAMPTVIFDEIDTGISGEIAIKVGKMMKQMSERHQVISISHLPQIAAQGTAHYYVYKDNSSSRTVSKMKKLSEEERIKEIAQMIGGAKPSETAIQSAKELLSLV
ncbi:MAG TPA: DNA repair protein RecN [Cytophagaceae bacterium]